MRLHFGERNKRIGIRQLARQTIGPEHRLRMAHRHIRQFALVEIYQTYIGVSAQPLREAERGIKFVRVIIGGRIADDDLRICNFTYGPDGALDDSTFGQLRLLSIRQDQPMHAGIDLDGNLRASRNPRP